MTSSMLTGERRFTTARRGGMTVLGKVAVPKPLNLPSQRLENHGQNPDVEIVPKGTLSWGSKPTSSTPNAWASSTLSPNADGGTSSPSHLSAGVSSGGNGSRPSTAGSDRTHEHNVAAWGSNSRPSSASGTLSSSQASLASLRPRSAETRPGSSQLSRFAETSSSHPTTWAPGTSTERLGILNAKNDGFSLSSGDFPSLGSEKDNPGKTNEAQGQSSHGCPGSPSGKLSHDAGKVDEASSEQDVKNGAVGMWRRDGPYHVDDGIQGGMNMWQGDPHHQYANSDIPPHHFDAWRGSHVPPLTGAWYRGHPGVPPYGPHSGPGGFPFEQYPHYRPHQIPHLANSHAVPPQGHGPRGPHPRSNDFYRAHMPESYVRPGMPFQPGYYPGPVGFEGYYGPPPMGYCNSSKQDISLMGMPPGPTVLNRFPAPNAHDPNNSNARSTSHGGGNNMFLPEQGECVHHDYARPPYKVLLKHHDERNRGDERGDTWKRSPALANTSHGDGICHEPGGMKNEWEVHSSEEAINENSKSHSVDIRRDISSDNVKFESVEGLDSISPAPYGWDKRSVTMEPSHGMAIQKGTVLAVARKESTLMKKIEGLNAKVRAHDDHFGPRNEEQNRPFVNAKVESATDDDTRSSTKYYETHGSDMSRTTYHASKGKNDHHPSKAKFSYRDDGWRKNPLPTECSAVVSSQSTIPASNVQNSISYPQVGDAELTVTSLLEKDEKESISESLDGQTQRAKKEELEKRALQLQKEEEERTREQKAKALAKLEELNRRMQQGDDSSSIHMVEKVPLTISMKQERGEGTIRESPNEPPFTKPGDVAEINGDIPPRQGSEKADLQPNTGHGPISTHEQDLHPPGAALQANERYNKRTAGYKQRQNVGVRNTDLNKPSDPVVVATSEAPKNHLIDDVSSEGAIHGAGSCNPNALSRLTESGLQQRKKGSRNGKSKQKTMDDTPPSIDTPPSVSAKLPTTMQTGDMTLKLSENEVCDISSVQATMNTDNGLQTSELHAPSSSKEGHVRVNDQRRPQYPRKISRNQRANRFVDKLNGSDAVVWAPVQPQTKREAVVEAVQKKVLPDDPAPPVTGDYVVVQPSSNNNPNKSKRAEMERYVPKPVAKELAQQGSSGYQHHTSITFGSHASVYINPDSNLDGWGMPIVDSVPRPVSFGEAIDVGGSKTGKDGKLNSSSTSRQDYNKSTVKPVRPDNNRSSKNTTAGRNHAQPAVLPDAKETDRTAVAPKENRISVPHWKPKSNVQVPPHSEKNSEVQGEVDVKKLQEEPRRRGGRQNTSRGGRPYSPNQPPAGLDDDFAPSETQHDRRFTSSGSRRGGSVPNSHHNSSRGRESSGDWSSGHDENRERRRNNSNMHYAYQPVGQHNKSGNFGGPAAAYYGSQRDAPRYRETGQSRRGGKNYHEKKGGNPREDVYDCD
ncbi:unnamed protein product [Cuscuta epithymum]|uniref:BAT2 N-terminal domain-containing protein n=1 Tax=Cuscuta epithymum TaxID=186058 RepID=A0AAV0GKV0_9ASTE|nr:unnamed protein product [Cuscuta epithymum]